MKRRWPSWLSPALVGCLLAACIRQEMADQPRHEALEASRFFADGQSARTLVPGTVAQEGFDTPRPPLSAALLQRGRERYDIFCAPCHDRTGQGQGMIVQRGFPAPPSYHTQRLRAAGDVHFYTVITEGLGDMYSYAARVPPHDRWAIVAYIRALQLSQFMPVEQLPPAVTTTLEGEGAP